MHGRSAGWVVALIWACMLMTASIGQPVDGKDVKLNPDTKAASPEEHTNASPEEYVRYSHSLSAAELHFVLRRKEVVLHSLNMLGIKSTTDSVPHIAVLGSGGGQRSSVALVGALYQMKEEGLLDTALYLAGLSGATWAMASLYSDPEWSTNLEAAVGKMSNPRVDTEKALEVLLERLEDTHFSLTDIWAVVIGSEYTKELDRRYLSEDAKNPINPYPIYTAINKNCMHGPSKGQWFELAPLESGFTDLGLFVNTSVLGRTGEKAEARQIDMFTVQAPQEINTAWDVLDIYVRCYQTVIKITEAIRENTDDPAVLSELEEVQNILKERLSPGSVSSYEGIDHEDKKKIFKKWGDQILESLQTWSQNLEEGPVKEHVTWLFHTILPVIFRWEWGTTTNFLYEYSGAAAVPLCVSYNKHLQLIDAGLELLLPFPPLLGEKRDTDLFIALEYSAEITFMTLIYARDYAAKMKKPFPHINETFLEEKDWPKDCYVFEGKGEEPTIVYLPIFNRKNCKDAEEVRTKMEEYATMQGPYSEEKIAALLEFAKENIKNNKETLLREINKAVLRKQKKNHGRFVV
ncbi:cytosolic phospholipase A2 gamma-like [Genypterus blacodes]|uniref:cytosolic phospholipase A2 gamma-like n=1 Tax=Genypterus blacodes TaxID=154954 RepID=UPI003F7612FF